MKLLLATLVLCCVIFDSLAQQYLVTVYEAATGEIHKLLPHSRGIDGLTWSNQGKLLVTGEEVTSKHDGSMEGYIRVFDMVSGEEIKTIDFGNTINELFFTNDDEYLTDAQKK